VTQVVSRRISTGRFRFVVVLDDPRLFEDEDGGEREISQSLLTPAATKRKRRKDFQPRMDTDGHEYI
jgi:hypothetical protein